MQLRRDVLFSFADVLGEFKPIIVIDNRLIISSLCSLYWRPGWFLLGLQRFELHWDHLLFYSAFGASHFLQLSKRRRGREREILKTNKTNLICVQHWINNKINSRKLSKSQPTPTHTHRQDAKVCVCTRTYSLGISMNWRRRQHPRQTHRQTDSFLDKLGATCIFAKLVDFYYNKKNNNNANNSAYLLFVVRFGAK